MTKTKGTKKTTRRTATTKRGKTETMTVVNARRVGAKTLATAIYARGGDFWDEVMTNVQRIQASSRPARAAQVEHATH